MKKQHRIIFLYGKENNGIAFHAVIFAFIQPRASDNSSKDNARKKIAVAVNALLILAAISNFLEALANVSCRYLKVKNL